MDQSSVAPVRVLHVDDEQDFADVTAEFLEREDERLRVETATSTADGLDRLADSEFDCIVSDYDMPGQNGIDFLRAVREDSPNLPFILFTGKGSEAVASDALSAGATDYLQKGRGTDQYELLTNRITNAVEQYRATQRAAASDRVRSLTRDVKQALMRADSRADAETRVCEIISDSGPYLFAWIGEIDPDTAHIEPCAAAGINESYLAEITVTADENPTGQGPGGTAVRERRVAVSQDITADPEFEPWREQALERGYRAVAAIPLEHDDTVYGILAVYAGRQNAFDEAERELLTELGEDIGYAFRSFDLRAQLRGERSCRQTLFETTPVPMATGELRGEGGDYRITDVNDAFQDVFGYEREEVTGTDLAELVVSDEEGDGCHRFWERAPGKATIAEIECKTADGPRECSITIVSDGEETGLRDGWYAWCTGGADGPRDQAIEELHSTTAALMEAETTADVATMLSRAVSEILDMPANGVHLYDESEGGLVPVAWTEQTEEIADELPTFTPGEGIAGIAFETGTPQIYDDISTVADRYNPDTDVRSQIVFPLATHGVLVIGSPEPNAFTETDASLAEIVAAHATTAFDRIDHEQKLTALHDVADALTAGDSVEEICERTIVASEHVLDFDLSVISLETEGQLVPKAVSRGISSDEITAMSVDEGIAGKTFRTGESFLIDDVDAWDEADPQGPFKSCISIPLGAQGNFQIVSETRAAFDETDLRLAELLASHAESALDRLAREEDLQRQNDRLEEFAGVVSHDLQNPLNVASARLELLREECNGEQVEAIDRALTRMDDLVGDLLTLAREGDRVSEMESVSLADVSGQCWQNVETDDATVHVRVGRTIRADRSRLAQLLENLYRNAVEHGSTGPDSQAQEDAGSEASEPSVADAPENATEHEREDMTITVGELDNGFYVEDDGSGIPEGERDDIFDAGYSTAEEGTGFGLSIVKQVADAHGWELRVTDGAAGGARFEITGVEFVA
jgi:PAS domain S-box-containing protein